MLFIPELGTKITNPTDWQFSDISENRNASLFQSEGLVHPSTWGAYGSISFKKTFPKHTVFQIDRIYIRKGKDAFSSISLIILETTDPKFLNRKKLHTFSKAKTYGRFFCSLDDFNKAGFLILR